MRSGSFVRKNSKLIIFNPKKVTVVKSQNGVIQTSLDFGKKKALPNL